MRCCAGHEADPSDFPPSRLRKSAGYCRVHLRMWMKAYRRKDRARKMAEMATGLRSVGG